MGKTQAEHFILRHFMTQVRFSDWILYFEATKVIIPKLPGGKWLSEVTVQACRHAHTHTHTLFCAGVCVCVSPELLD